MERVSVQSAKTDRDLEDAKRLFTAYTTWLNVDLTFQNFSKELNSLPGRYSAPKGDMLLARNGEGVAMGCVALRPLGTEGTFCEMKRLYVLPEGRGLGLGRLLVGNILERARDCGYSEMRLDTLSRMTDALSLYTKFGFEHIPAYYQTPLENTVFLAKRL